MKKFAALVLAICLLAVTPIAFANETITIGASPTPHAIILEYIKDDLAALGYDLEILEVTDYNQANPATASGDMDCNFFQHMPFLNNYNANANEDEQLVAAIGIHCEPYGIYPGTKSDLSEIAEGDIIAVTNDPSNEARALLLLQDAGLIVLPEGTTADSGVQAQDIVETNGIIIKELNAEMIPAALDDVAFAVINGNYVLDAGMTVKDDALYTEADGVTSEIYTNYIVCRPEDAESDWMAALRQVLCTEDVFNFILNQESFAGGVIPTFTYGE